MIDFYSIDFLNYVVGPNTDFERYYQWKRDRQQFELYVDFLNEDAKKVAVFKIKKQ